LHPDAAGIDCGSAEHVVAVPRDRDATPIRAFATFTRDLHRLAEWLANCRVTHVAIEATGVYGIPVVEILEARGCQVILVNARHVKNVPGARVMYPTARGVDLSQIDGIGPYSALRLIAEIGTDMGRGPTEHFTSWLTRAPHNTISGGRLLSSRTPPSANRAAAIFRLAAMTLGRTPDRARGLLSPPRLWRRHSQSHHRDRPQTRGARRPHAEAGPHLRRPRR
jgi:transposase